MQTLPENQRDTRQWACGPVRTLCTTRVVEVVASQVRCPRTGMEKEFCRFVFPDWVNVIATTHTGDLLLIRQYRFGTSRIEIEIPGGAVNAGEAPLAAGLRELLEETGYAGEGGRIIGKVCPNPAIQSNFCHTVLVENARQISLPRQDDMEDISTMIVPLQEVELLLAKGDIHHGLVLNALMFYSLDRKKTAESSLNP